MVMNGEWPLNSAATARGVQRCLVSFGCVCVTELTLPYGGRLDIAALSPTGEVIGVEIKVSVADLKGDTKWTSYLDYCDRFYFAVPTGFDLSLPPAQTGLIAADPFGAEIIRESQAHPIAAARRKAMTLLFARVAAMRLMTVRDPGLQQGP
jgi:hypothetical protein